MPKCIRRVSAAGHMYGAATHVQRQMTSTNEIRQGLPKAALLMNEFHVEEPCNTDRCTLVHRLGEEDTHPITPVSKTLIIAHVSHKHLMQMCPTSCSKHDLGRYTCTCLYVTRLSMCLYPSCQSDLGQPLLQSGACLYSSCWSLHVPEIVGSPVVVQLCAVRLLVDYELCSWLQDVISGIVSE